jgi:putative transposase
MLKQEGWQMNHKRVERLWRKEGLKVPQKQPKRGLLWLNRNYDFMIGRMANRRAFKILNIIDVYTREFLSILVKRKITSQGVIDQLFHLLIFRGMLEHITSDNRPELMTKMVRKWLRRSGVKTLFIEPGNLWENGYIESFNSKIRDILLNRRIFTTLTKAKILIEE